MRCFTKKTDTKFARTSIPTTKTMRACCSDAGDFQRPSREISLGIDHILLVADTTKPVSKHKNKTPSEGMGFCFWNAAGRFELTASTCAKRVKFRGEAGFLRMAMPFAGCREASSSLVARSKKIRPPFGWSYFFGAAILLRKIGRLRAGD